MQLATQPMALAPLTPPALYNTCDRWERHEAGKQGGRNHNYDYDVLLSDFSDTLASLGLPNKQAIVLAVSGGGDSMGMAALFADWHKRLTSQKKPNRSASLYAPPLSAMVVDHGIRPDSDEEAENTKTQLRALGISTITLRISHPPPKSGIQAWARQQRYDLLMAHARPKNAILGLAHQAGDQSETIEMRLAKKSGLRGLRGMAVDTMRHGVRVIRPCLTMSREALAMAAKHKGLTIAHDPSNDDTRFLRPRLRAEKAKRQGDKTDISDTQLLRLGKAAQHITYMLDWHISQYYTVSPWGYGLVASKTLENPAVFCHSARLLARHMHGGDYVPNEASFIRLYHRLITASTNSNSISSGNAFTTTLAGCEWRMDARTPHHIIVLREAELPLPTVAIPPATLSGLRTIIFDRRWLLRLPVAAESQSPKSVEAMGKRRFGQLRRRHPKLVARLCAYIPPRAFWSLPVVIDSSPTSLYSYHNNTEYQAYAQCRLENGGNAQDMRQDMKARHTMPGMANTMAEYATGHQRRLVLDDGVCLPYISEDASRAHAHHYSAVFLGAHTTTKTTRSVW